MGPSVFLLHSSCYINTNCFFYLGIRMYRPTVQFNQETPQMVLELVFRGPGYAEQFNYDDCRNILLSSKAVYGVYRLAPLTPQVQLIGVGLDLAIVDVKELVQLLASVIQQADGLIFLYVVYHSTSTGAIGEFRWDRTKGGYSISHKATIAIEMMREIIPPMTLITMISAALSDPSIHSTSFNITPTQDPNEVLIAPY